MIVELLIRTTNRLTEAARLAGQDETGPLSNHVGDVIEIRQNNHDHSNVELREFAVIRVPNFPSDAAARAMLIQIVQLAYTWA